MQKLLTNILMNMLSNSLPKHVQKFFMFNKKRGLNVHVSFNQYSNIVEHENFNEIYYVRHHSTNELRGRITNKNLIYLNSYELSVNDKFISSDILYKSIIKTTFYKGLSKQVKNEIDRIFNTAWEADNVLNDDSIINGLFLTRHNPKYIGINIKINHERTILLSKIIHKK